MNLNLDSYDQEYLVNIIKRKVEEKLGKMPKRGVFAGQAVASAIYEALGLTNNAPYNDIDIFGEHKDLPSFELEMAKIPLNGRHGLSKMRSSEGLKIEQASFGVELSSINQIGYAIHHSFIGYDNPNVNFVEVEYYIGERRYLDPINEKTNEARSVIESFDLNCVQVALDLRTNKLIWTRAFQDFLFSKEIKPIYFGTPMHTAIRMLKKEKDIDFATLDIETEMLKLQTARQIGVEVEMLKKDYLGAGRDFIPGNLFSDVYKKRFQANKPTMEKYFRIKDKVISVEDKQKNFAVLEPMSFNSKVVRLFMDSIIIPDCGRTEDGRIIPPFIDEKISDFERFYNLFSVDSKKNKQLINLISEMVEDAETGKRSLGLRMVISHLIKTDRKDLSGLQAEHLKRLIKVTDQHPMAIVELMKTPLKMREIAQIAKNINWLDKNNLRHYVGFIEQGLYREEKPSDAIIYSNGAAKKDVFHRFTSIRDITQNYASFKVGSAYRNDTLTLSELLSGNFKADIKEKNRRLLTKGMSISVEPMANNLIENLKPKTNVSFSVREITNWSNLIIEGGEMKHCVGGYWEAINSHRSAIFHIDTETDGKINPSTIEIALNKRLYKKEFVIVQHQGPFNQTIPEENRAVGLELLNSLNDELKKVADKTLSDFPDKSNLTVFEKFYLGSISNTSRENVKKGFFNNDLNSENRIEYEYQF